MWDKSVVLSATSYNPIRCEKEVPMHLFMFDIDGTLVNTYGFDEACYVEAARIVLGVHISSNWEEYSFATDAGILNEAIDRYNISGNKKHIHLKFRQVFTMLILDHIALNPDDVSEITGAAQFIRHLGTIKNVKIAIATGGWEETAKLKLKAADISVDKCAFSSSSDHHKRTEIMKIAESRAASDMPFESITYFGDASWDREASKDLRYGFILVGNQIEHEMQIDDFRHKDKVLSIIGL